MADTIFVDQTTVIVADWLNDVNNTVYQALGSAGVSPTTPAQVRANIGVSSVGSTIVKGDGNGAYTNASASDVVTLLGSTPVNEATNAATAVLATDALSANAVASGGTIASNVTATTQAAGDNSTKVATTAYVDAAASVLRGSIDGYTLSTVGSSTTMTIAAGQATNSVNTGYITLVSAINKTTSAWSVGTGNGGLDTGTIANNTWYHFYAIHRPDTGVVDVVFSTNPSAPTLPANYTQYAFIESGLTDGAGNWRKFVDAAGYMLWDAAVADVSASNFGTSAVSRTLTVPTGRAVSALIIAGLTNLDAGADCFGLLSPLSVSDQAPGISLSNLPLTRNAASHTYVSGGQMEIPTNTSAQIRSRLSYNSAGVTLRISTLGWKRYGG